MRILRATLLLFFSLALTPWGLSQTTTAVSESATRVSDQANPSITAPGSFDEVIGRVVEREHYFNEKILRLHPLIETYIQNLKNDDATGPVPISDRYFLGRLDLTGDLEDRFAGQAAGQFSVIARLNILPQLSELYSLRFRPAGFAQMVLVDRDFDRKSYSFTYVRREFLGEIRCVVIRRPAYKGERGWTVCGKNLGRGRELQYCALQWHLQRPRQHRSLLAL